MGISRKQLFISHGYKELLPVLLYLNPAINS